MKNVVLDSIMKEIKKYNNYNDVKLSEIRYGLESLYLSIFKLIIIVILSFFIHTTKYLCLFFLTYSPLRLMGFGLHTKNSLQCWILSIVIFTLFPYLIKNLIVNKMLLFILSILLLVLIILYAPADTKKRPIINKNKRIMYKTITTIITSIYIVIIYFTNNMIIKKLLFFSILLEVLLILPISYRVLGLSYNNYILYRERRKKE